MQNKRTGRPKTMSNPRYIGFNLEAHQYADVTRAARRRGVKIADFVRRAVADAIIRNIEVPVRAR